MPLTGNAKEFVRYNNQIPRQAVAGKILAELDSLRVCDPAIDRGFPHGHTIEVSSMKMQLQKW